MQKPHGNRAFGLTVELLLCNLKLLHCNLKRLECAETARKHSMPTQCFKCGYYKFASKLLHFDTFLSRSGPSYFRTQIHLPKTIASLLNGFILTLFCSNLDQTIFEPEEPFPKLCQIWSILLHLDTFLSRSGPIHFRARRANPKAHVLFVQNEKNVFCH